MIDPNEAQQVFHAFADACDRIGLGPADPDVGVLLAHMVATHWWARGGGSVLLGQLLHEIAVTCQKVKGMER